MNKELQNRFRSKIFWAAVIAQLLAFLTGLGVIDVTQSEMINEIITGVLQLLVLIGVFNDPTNAKGW